MDESICVLTPEIVGTASHGGLKTLCTGLILEYSRVVYISLVGNKTANKALWAALADRRTIQVETLDNNTEFFSYGRDTAYLKREAQLPETGLEHMVLLHPQASLQHMRPNEEFYVLAETEEKAIPLFGNMLDKALSLPIKQEWSPLLWQWGCKPEDSYSYANILPLLGKRYKGTAQAWRVDADMNFWKKIWERGFEEGVFK